jgi:hypothetical protein
MQPSAQKYIIARPPWTRNIENRLSTIAFIETLLSFLTAAAHEARRGVA